MKLDDRSLMGRLAAGVAANAAIQDPDGSRFHILRIGEAGMQAIQAAIRLSARFIAGGVGECHDDDIKSISARYLAIREYVDNADVRGPGVEYVRELAVADGVVSDSVSKPFFDKLIAMEFAPTLTGRVTGGMEAATLARHLAGKGIEAKSIAGMIEDHFRDPNKTLHDIGAMTQEEIDELAKAHGQ